MKHNTKEGLKAVKEMLIKVINECQDENLLDLVFKILIHG